MITLFATLIGFLSSLVPDGMKMLRDHQDRKHELVLLEMQMKLKEADRSERLEEIRTNADIAESAALYKTYKVGVEWVDALNGTVRPVLAYAFFALYTAVKFMQWSMLPDNPLPWHVDALWNEEDRAIFAGIIAFYFGSRAMKQSRK